MDKQTSSQWAQYVENRNNAIVNETFSPLGSNRVAEISADFVDCDKSAETFAQASMTALMHSI